MPDSYDCNVIYLKVNRFEGLILLGEQQFIGQKAGAAIEGALGCHSRQFGKIIAFREMREDDVSRLAVVGVFQEIGRRFIGEVTNARKYPLLDRPWIRAIAEHFEVVIRLEQQQIEAFELGFDIGRNVAEIGGHGHAYAGGAEDETDRVGGVMGDGEGADGDVADFKRLAGLEVLDAGKPGGLIFPGWRAGWSVV